MKKTIVFLALVLLFTISLFLLSSCGDKEESKGESSNVSVESTESTESTESKDESDVSDESDESDESEESDPEPEPEPENEDINREEGADLDGKGYLKKGDDVHGVVPAGDLPVYINKLNKAGGEGDSVVLTGDVISLVGEVDEFTDFIGIVAKYDMTEYRYFVTKVLDAGSDKSDIEIPADGFVILVSTGNAKDSADALWKTNFTTSKVNIAKYTKDEKVAVQGISVADISFDFYRTSNAPTLDGIIGAGEYGDAIMEIAPNNPFCDYRHFKAEDQYATGNFYATYDDDYLYLAWEIASEHHYFPTATEDSGMWAVDCVQINIVTINPSSTENYGRFNGWTDQISKDRFVSQLGVGVDESGASRTVKWFGSAGDWEGAATRDDNAGKTIYEAKIPKSAFTVEGYELDLTDGNKFGVSFSINTHDGTAQRVMRLRDGGGIFGSNDWSKTPVVTLKGE